MSRRVMSKYDYVFDETCYRKISEESCTVPNMVLSMAEIYRKYAVTGDISQLPGGVRPHNFDDGDEFEDSFESEEYVDTLLYVQDLRSRQPSPANSAAENIQEGEAVKMENDEGNSPANTQKPDAEAATPPDE